jgi:hypothetical protein
MPWAVISNAARNLGLGLRILLAPLAETLAPPARTGVIGLRKEVETIGLQEMPGEVISSSR